MKLLVEKRNELEAKSKKLASIFEEAGADIDLEKVKSLEGSTKDKADKIKQLNAELSDLGQEVDRLVLIEKAAQDNKAREEAMSKGRLIPQPGESPKIGPGQFECKSIGQLFVESLAYKDRHSQKESVLDMEIKTLFETGAGWAPQAVRSGQVVEIATRPIQVTDLLPTIPTGQNAYVYMEETTFTNNAAEAAEAAQYGEAALVLTERSSSVRKIGVFLPVTDEQLEDVAGASAYVDGRLRFSLQQRLDSQILVGNGTPPNLTGILNVSGIQTQAKAADTTPDAVYKALVKVRVTGRALPNVCVFHPNDWQDIKLLRTADGIYIWGSPSEAGPDRIWGIPVVQSDAITENTGLVGDFANHILLVNRRGIEVKVSDSHSDYFIKGKKAIRADVRVALPTLRPAAFCTVTGI